MDIQKSPYATKALALEMYQYAWGAVPERESARAGSSTGIDAIAMAAPAAVASTAHNHVMLLLFGLPPLGTPVRVRYCDCIVGS
jgi:hypothetical protein